MSWLVDMAGKAESLLNKLDQNAAVALSSVNEQAKAKSVKSRNRIQPQIQIQQQDHEEAVAIATKQKSEVIVRSEEGNPSKVKRPLLPDVGARSKSSSPKSSFFHDESISKKSKANEDTQNLSGRSDTTKPATDEELLDYLNSKETGFDEASLLKKELTTQVNEMRLMVKNHKKLEKDHESLRKLYEAMKLKNQTPLASSTISGNSDTELTSGDSIKVLELEKLLIEKTDELERVSDRLEQALGRLESADQSRLIQNQLEQMQLENRSLIESNAEVNQKFNESIIHLEATAKQLQSTRDSLIAAENEYLAYKSKAKSILRSKDDLIINLEQRKLQSSEDQSNPSLSTDGNHFQIEVEALRNERELFQAEISQSASQVEGLKEENIRLENELMSLRSINSDLQSILTKERQRVRVAQEENLQLSQNSSSLQLDLERERIERKKLVEQHRRTPSNQIMSRSLSNSDFQLQPTPSRQSPSSFHDFNPEESEQLRTRITALSQSLLEKQSLINELSSDKQLFQINIERLEAQIQELTSSSQYAGSNNGLCHPTVISSQPLYLSESPWDSSVTLRMKRVYSQVDSLCCQFGMAMRQRPNLRLGFSAYVLLLHLWVFFVLFSWSHSVSPPNPNFKSLN